MRVLFVSNSQGTAAGLPESERWQNYPSRLQEELSELDCCYWMLSSLAVDLVDNLFSEIVLQHRPDLLVLQCGIIEGAPRILPKGARQLLGLFRLGRWFTGALHHRRYQWLAWLDRRGWAFQDLDRKTFDLHVASLLRKCRERGIQVIAVQVPQLSPNCEGALLPGGNALLEEYNRVLAERCREAGVLCLDPFAGFVAEALNPLYVGESVHFSCAGHQRMAEVLADVIDRELLRRGNFEKMGA